MRALVLLIITMVTSGAELRKLIGHKRRVAAIAFAPDGKTLASGSWDHSVKLWDVATGIVFQHDNVKFPETIFVAACLCD